MQNYAYPIDPDWTTEEIVVVVELFSAVEQAYEGGVPLAKFQTLYQQFKQIVTSIGEEKRLDRHFQAASGYSLYRVVKLMKERQAQAGKQQDLLKL